jgi:hypothetical protein
LMSTMNLICNIVAPTLLHYFPKVIHQQIPNQPPRHLAETDWLGSSLFVCQQRYGRYGVQSRVCVLSFLPFILILFIQAALPYSATYLKFQ